MAQISQGEKVSADEPLVELETDKVNVEVPSPTNGSFRKYFCERGRNSKCGLFTWHCKWISNKKDRYYYKKLKTYTPPSTKKKKTDKNFKEKKLENQKKLNRKKIEEPELRIKEEEPLILDDFHVHEKEKIVQKVKQSEVSPAARKMAD